MDWRGISAGLTLAPLATLLNTASGEATKKLSTSFSDTSFCPVFFALSLAG